jgi:signal transduction histidine kinase
MARTSQVVRIVAVSDKVARWRCDNGGVASRILVAPTQRFRRVALPAIGVVNAVAVVILPLRLAVAPSTFASVSAATAGADLVAGVSLLACGLVTTALRPASRVGALAILASVAWFASDWVGWEGGPPLIRSLGMVVAPMLGAIVLHLVAAGSGELRRTTVRTLVAVAYVVTFAISAMRAVVRDPFLDLNCFASPRNCRVNVFLLWPDTELAGRLDGALVVVMIVIGLSIAYMAARRLVVATGPARRIQWPILIPGLIVGGCETAYGIAVLWRPGLGPSDAILAAIFLAQAAGITMLAAGIAWTSVRARRITESVAHLATDMGRARAPSDLQSVLARSLGDPDLRVAYRLPGDGGYVDAQGDPVVDPSTRPGKVATPIVRDGERIAVVLRDAGLVESQELERTIGSATRLAVDNERLQAEVLAQIRELRDSRSRIVETADAARRHLERNLHDGAQQRLLALSYQLRLGRAAATREGNDELALLLEQASDETQVTLDELRELAHGIFPAVLTEAGLGPAVAGLADRSQVPVEVVGSLDGRCPIASETAAFVVIENAVRMATSRGATYVSIVLARSGGNLIVGIEEDGLGPADDVTDLADRAGAANGLLVDVTDGPGLALRLEVPCA